MKQKEKREAIFSSDSFISLYGKSQTRFQKEQERYHEIARQFRKNFGEKDPVLFFSVPGRTEIGGNHTDHQNGCVVAAAVDLDIVAAVAKREDGIIRFYSEGFSEIDQIDTGDTQIREEEKGTSAALLRGICHRMVQLGYSIGGFDAYSSSQIPRGSGLSSSAAFEVLVVTILNHLYNYGKIDVAATATISQYAENCFFGKPCGLMDQMACAAGGVVGIDFKDPLHPALEKIPFRLQEDGYTLFIVHTGGSHADLTGEYQAIQQEMKQVAQEMGRQVLRECKEEVFYRKIPELRKKLGDRAILRAIHFFNENKRATEEKEALQRKDSSAFYNLVLQSGQSSYQYLQNLYACRYPKQQAIPLALALSERLLAGTGGAWRVHGGGFAGTIQAFVPLSLSQRYRQEMETVFGKGSCMELSIREQGGLLVG